MTIVPRFIHHSLLLATLALPLSGCVNAIELAKFASKPKIVFDHPARWDCNGEVKLPGRYRDIETCQKCVNVGPVAEAVRVNEEAATVAPQGAVLVCPTSALVDAALP